MSVAFDEIQKRHARRCQVIRDSRGLKAPLLTDAESVKEHLKLIKDKQAELINECFMVDQDVQVLIHALNSLGSKNTVDQAISMSWEACWKSVPLEEQEVYHRRTNEEEEKALKQTGDVPGQTKLKFKDDGSTAEAAGPATTKKRLTASSLRKTSKK